MSEHITHPAAVRRLERPTSDRRIAGVAGGLGRYFDLNPSFFRIGFVVLTLLGGAGLLIYLTAAFVMPDEGKEKSVAEQILADRKDRPWPLVGLAVAGVAIVVLLSHATVWPAAGAGWILVLFAGLAILWTSRAERRAGRILRVLVALTALFAADLGRSHRRRVLVVQRQLQRRRREQGLQRLHRFRAEAVLRPRRREPEARPLRHRPDHPGHAPQGQGRRRGTADHRAAQYRHLGQRPREGRRHLRPQPARRRAQRRHPAGIRWTNW